MKPAAGSRSMALRGALAVAVVAAACGAPTDAPGVAQVGEAATFGRLGLVPTTTTACVVVGPVAGAASPSPVSQAEVDVARDAIDGWTQGWTSLRFRWSATVSAFSAVTLDGSTYLTSCARAADGTFTDRMRIYLDHRALAASATPYPNALTVPGCGYAERRGTQKVDAAGNPVLDASGRYVANRVLWAMFPETSAANPDCLYSVHLATGQPRNNYLHESGHAIGFSHEHMRGDADCVVAASPEDGLFVTRYDRDSVMHYRQTCSDRTQVAGNLGAAGLSDADRLGAEIMYPANATARVWGSLAGWAGGALGATSDWVSRGAFVGGAGSEPVLTAFEWWVDGARISTGTRPSAAQWGQVAAGRHTLELRFRDAWGRAYAGAVRVEVLPTRADYLRRAGAATAFAL